MKFALKRLRTLIGSALCAACLLGLAPAFGQDSATETPSHVADKARRVTILYLGETGGSASTEARFKELVALLRRLDSADAGVKATRQFYSLYEIAATEGETIGEATNKNLLDALTALEKISGEELELRLFIVLPVVNKEYGYDEDGNKSYDWYLSESEDVEWRSVDSAIRSGRDGYESIADVSNFQRVFAVVDLITNEPTTGFLSELASSRDEEGATLGYVCLDSLAPANYLTLVKNCLEARSARLKASLRNGDLFLFDAVRYIAKNGTAASATTLKSVVSDDAEVVLFGKDYALVRDVLKTSDEDTE